jgi:hypothetical protein
MVIERRSSASFRGGAAPTRNEAGLRPRPSVESHPAPQHPLKTVGEFQPSTGMTFSLITIQSPSDNQGQVLLFAFKPPLNPIIRYRAVTAVLRKKRENETSIKNGL